MKLLDYRGFSQLRTAKLAELEELAEDIRSEIIRTVENNNGHLGSNLGVVEITISLLKTFDLDDRDLILFDTGHETYPFKLLTGRAKSFPTIRTFHGLSGFQEISESKYDALSNGHAGTALSTAIGYALTGNYRNIVVVIGDAAFLNGMNLEALSHLGTINQKIIIVLNDNGMSISKNISVLQKISSRVRANKLVLWGDKTVGKFKYVPVLQCIYWMYRLYIKVFRHIEIPGLFTGFNIDYIGPVNGNSITKMSKTLMIAIKKNHSVVVHAITKKGCGYEPAINDKLNLHSVSHEPMIEMINKNSHTWSEAAASIIMKSFEKNSHYLVCAAMQAATKMDDIFKKYPLFCIDVGISEEHAVSLTAGLLMAKKKVILSLYSTFLQRGYDQLLHDIVRNNLNPILLIDRAGLNGEDGISHHGIYDVGMLRSMGNNLIITQPCCEDELNRLFKMALENDHNPFAIRYPKAPAISHDELVGYSPVERIGQWTYLIKNKNNRVCFIAYGDDVVKAYRLILKHKLPIDLINACFIQPYDIDLIKKEIFSSRYTTIGVYEQIVGSVGLADVLRSELALISHDVRKCPRLFCYYFRNGQIHHGKNEELLVEAKMHLADVLSELVTS